MRLGNAGACDLVGFPPRHGELFQEVANQLDVVILSRAVGKSCTKLIEEGYGLKGFRIDTKSCSWGPMMGFVCMDPRLNKEGHAKAEFNTEKTIEALSGHVIAEHSTPAPGEGAGWKAEVVPIAISGARLRQLIAGVDGKRIHPEDLGLGLMRGVSEHTGARGTVRFPYMLMLMPTGRDPKYGQIGDDVWGIFVQPGKGFKQQYPYPAVRTIWRNHGDDYYEALLGLANPGTGHLGYKACVTGDYDLFGVWPRNRDKGRATVRPTGSEIALAAQLGPSHAKYIPRIEDNWDARRLHIGLKEHFQLGNITKRINTVKILLNTRIQADTQIKVGQAVHHSDEAGNPNVQLMKSLNDSLPVIAFVPNHAKAGSFVASPQKSQQLAMLTRLQNLAQHGAVGIETIDDLKLFCRDCMTLGFALDLRRDWAPQLGF